MSITKRAAPLSLLVALGACASSGAPGPEATSGAAASPSVTARAPASTTFSAVQADRGRDTFRARCTECHSSAEFAEPRFRYRWAQRSAGSLYRFIRTSMPETAPGTLEPEEAVALVAYILRMNGFRPGAGELAADRAILDGISLASIRGG